MKIFEHFYRWIMRLMSHRKPIQTTEDETVEVLRKKKFYEDEAKVK